MINELVKRDVRSEVAELKVGLVARMIALLAAVLKSVVVAEILIQFAHYSYFFTRDEKTNSLLSDGSVEVLVLQRRVVLEIK